MVSAQRHLALLRGELREGEVERLWIRADREPQGHSGVLLVTDRRVLFSGLGFVQQSQEAWPLALTRREPGEPALLVLRASGTTERFRGRGRDVARAGALIEELGSAAPSDSLAGELERLAALRDSGVLTEAEFESGKRRLLG